MNQLIKRNAEYVAWGAALVFTIASLYVSNVLRIPPCDLCWYQRVMMFPLVLLIPIGIWRRDEKMYQYILPMSAIGMATAAFHYLLQLGVISEGAAPCISGIPCTTKAFDFFGFVTPPLVSFIAFGIITYAIILSRIKHHETHDQRD